MNGSTPRFRSTRLLDSQGRFRGRDPWFTSGIGTGRMYNGEPTVMSVFPSVLFACFARSLFSWPLETKTTSESANANSSKSSCDMPGGARTTNSVVCNFSMSWPIWTWISTLASCTTFTTGSVEPAEIQTKRRTLLAAVRSVFRKASRSALSTSDGGSSETTAISRGIVASGWAHRATP